MKFCFAILFVFLSSTRTQKLENSFVVVDSKNIYHLIAINETKIFDVKHNLTDPIHFLGAKVYRDGFDVVYGGCSSEFVGYYRQSGNITFFGCISLNPENVSNVCGVTPASTQNTFYASLKTGILAFYDGRTNQIKLISMVPSPCRFNLLLNADKNALYFLEGSCDPDKSNKLGIQGTEPNSAVSYLNIPEQVIKMKIYFSTNEIFAITESNDLKKGKIDSDKVTLEAVKNVNQKILDIALTPSDIYYIEKGESIIRKIKRSDTEAPVQVFKSVTFGNLRGISYLHHGDVEDPGGKGKDKGFSASINLHLAFYFAMFLVNLELWNL